LSKTDVNIINTSRGGIINEDALIRFFKSINKNAFAAFDVFLEEPAFNNPLLS
jgi:lactate dehydrogenase-like 2-hydroxyacid dehydrogenase